MRVLFLTHYYPPELGAAPARIAALARGLADRGVQVSVHTGFPHYPSGRIADPYRNGRLPEDPGALAAAFASLRASPQESLAMGRRGRARAQEFDREAAIERWWELLAADPLL